MTEDALVQTIETKPAELEQRLVVVMRQIAERDLQRPEVMRALNAAERLKPGRVITGDEAAAEVADLVACVIEGEKALAEAVKEALRIPNAMDLAVRQATLPTRDLLIHARQNGNEARLRYQQALRDAAVRAETKARQEAQEAAQRAAAAAVEVGDDVPPPLEVAPVVVPRTVAGGTGAMGTQVRVEVGKIVDWDAVPREWLLIDKLAARSAFLHQRPKVNRKLAPGQTVVWQGVEFTGKEGVVNRRAR